MRALAPILLTLFTFIFVNCSSYQYPNDVMSPYHGKVKSISSVTYSYNFKTLQKIEKNYTSKYVVEYDKKGRKISSWSYKNGKKSWGRTISFQKRGKKIISTFRNPSDTTRHEYLLTFNSDKKLVKSVSKNGGYVIHTYNEDGKKIAQTGYSKEGKRQDSTHYHLDASDNIIKKEFFDDEGYSAVFKTFDENGFEIESYHINKKGKTEWLSKCKNDQFGNKIDVLSYYIKDRDTVLKSHEKRYLDYDEFKNVIKDSSVIEKKNFIYVKKDTFTYWD